MAALRTDEPAAANCPRCGYDQRGVVATWSENCPLNGVCSECGLELAWAEVLLPEKFKPRWCVEFTPRRRSVPLACVKTLLRSFWPWSFWSRLKVSFPIRHRRLMAYIACLTATIGFLYVILQTGAAVFCRWQIQARFDRDAVMVQRAIATLEQTLRDGPQPPVVELQNRLARLKSLAATQPPTIRQSYAAAIVEAVIFPLAARSSGVLALSDGRTAPYLPPDGLWDAVFQGTGTRWSGARTPIDLAPSLAFWLGLNWLALLLLPLSFVLIPVSRRRAKVRWSHVGRVAIYSLFIPFLIIWICAALLVVTCAAPAGADACERLAVTSTRYLPVLLLTLWWAAAIRCYLKIPHGFATAALLVLVLILVMLGVGYLLFPMPTINVIETHWPFWRVWG